MPRVMAEIQIPIIGQRSGVELELSLWYQKSGSDNSSMLAILAKDGSGSRTVVFNATGTGMAH